MRKMRDDTISTLMSLIFLNVWTGEEKSRDEQRRTLPAPGVLSHILSRIRSVLSHQNLLQSQTMGQPEDRRRFPAPIQSSAKSTAP
jgi:hypothetical protein